VVAGVRTDDGWGDGRWDGDRTERIVNADGTETLVIHDDRDGFPFGIIVIPLVIFGFVALARGVVGRGPGGGPGRWGGPGVWGYGPPWAYSAGTYGGPGGPANGPAGSASMAGAGPPAAPPWFEEWHRRVHGGQPSASPAPETPAQSVAPSPAVD